MNAADALRHAPEALSWGSPGTRYRRVDALVAEHDRPAGASTRGARLVLEDGRVVVWSSPPPSTASGRLGPVYGAGDDERHEHLAVPTGRVLVQLAPGSAIAPHTRDIERAGFVVESIPRSAAHTAWVHAASRSIAEVLRDLAVLGSLPGVVRVEPQMLLPRARR